jgi:uncharacterized protein YycO
MPSIDIVVRVGSGIEGRIIRNRKEAGRWTHAGILFSDGSLFDCSAKNGVSKISWDEFSKENSLDTSRRSIRLAKKDILKIRRWCSIKHEELTPFDHSYPNWSTTRTTGFYCSTFILDALWQAVGINLMENKQATPMVWPFIGEVNIIFPAMLL